MRFAHLGLVIVLLAPLPVVADIAPPRPQPPPPGPAEADIRGVGVIRDYGYWRGRRWLTFVKSCAPTQEACKETRLSEARCFVTGIDDRVIAGGDIAALVGAEKAATKRPIRLRLEGCGLSDIVLNP